MDNNLEELLRKFRDGTISDEEKAVLDTWYIEEAVKKELPNLSSSELRTDLESMMQFNPTIEAKKKRVLSFYWPAAAAACLVAVFTVLYYVQLTKPNFSDEIKIGGSKATLTLSSGDVIDLTKIKVDESVVMNGVTIHKSNEGTITYQPTLDESTLAAYDEISTPRGGEFKLVLVDGTQIWLNANSSLKFFSNMQASEREVWLKGEAYFEVTHNKEKPFIVKSDQHDIRVLGTKFNVRSIAGQSQTTLIEGSVALRDGRIKLKPGQQLTTKNNIDQPVSTVDVEPYLAWKDGYFLFNNERLDEIMEKIADWYDIEVEFKDSVQAEKLWATVSKYRDIKEVLNMIEMTEAAHFSIKGRRVIVTK